MISNSQNFDMTLHYFEIIMKTLAVFYNFFFWYLLFYKCHIWTYLWFLKCLDNKRAVRLLSDSLKIYHLTPEVEWLCTTQLGFTQNKLMQPLKSLLVTSYLLFKCFSDFVISRDPKELPDWLYLYELWKFLVKISMSYF